MEGRLGNCEPVLVHIYIIFNALETGSLETGCLQLPAPPVSCETELEWNFCKWTELHQRNNLHLSFIFSGKWPSKPEYLLICQVFSMRESSLAVSCRYYIIVINKKDSGHWPCIMNELGRRKKFLHHKLVLSQQRNSVAPHLLSQKSHS